MENISAAPPSHGKRPNLQGLRALAILSVLLWHIWPQRFPNGLFGVEMYAFTPSFFSYFATDSSPSPGT